MVDQRISELTDGGSFQSGDEFVINRGGVNRRVQVSATDTKLDVYATTSQAVAATAGGVFMDPVTTKNAIQTFAIVSGNASTTAQATAATSDGTFMTPAVTDKAIRDIAFTAATSFATTAQAEAGTDNSTVMNPVLTKNAIDALAVTNVSEDTDPSLGGYLALGGKGLTIPCTSGTTELQPRDICLVTTSGVSLANASSEVTTDGLMVMALTSVAASTSANFLVQGIYITSALTRGDTLYLATANGDFTTSKPAATGEQVRIIGYSLSTTELYFDPDNTWLENA